jgi:hypothetical protein
MLDLMRSIDGTAVGLALLTAVIITGRLLPQFSRTF